jgi:hypothetical protein
MLKKARSKNLGIGSLLVLAFIFLSIPKLDALQLPEGLVLYYKFDEQNKNIKDWSDKNNTGVTKGNPEWIEGPERMGKALRFTNSSDYIEVADSESLNPDYITISMWVKSELTAGSIETLRKFAWDTLGYLIKIEPQFNYNYMFLFDGQQARGVKLPLVEKDKWEHIAVTFDGEEQIGYYNGEIGLFGGSPSVLKWAGVLKHTNQSLTIGGISGFRGALDEIAIYNRALSEEEIKTSMASGHVLPVKPMGKLTTTWSKLKNFDHNDH